jgi:hypothetical protein
MHVQEEGMVVPVPFLLGFYVLFSAFLHGRLPVGCVCQPPVDQLLIGYVRRGVVWCQNGYSTSVPVRVVESESSSVEVC